MRVRLSPLLLAPLLVVAGCGSDSPGPAWLDVAAALEPLELADVAATWPTTLSTGGSTRVAPDESGVWIETTLGAGDWIRADRPGAWSSERPWDGAFACAGNGPTRLIVDGVTFQQGSGNEIVESGLYYLDESRLYIAVDPESGPPTEAHFAQRADLGKRENGTWRLRTLDHTGVGIPVYETAPAEVRLDVPAASALSFTTVFEQLPFGLDEASDAPHPTANFRIRLDGSVLFEGAGLGTGETHRVALPVEGVPGARLTFELAGGAGRGVFFAPTIGPAEVGDYRARPWETDRPNLVLFLADTFRADNLELYGGKPGLTPELAAFAAESRRYLEARSAAAWTLPSISSILTGLFPPQHGAVDYDRAIARSLTTIAETLGRYGYRTIAVTDSGFFSPPYGLDQGFELFYENRIRHWHLTKTIDQALAQIDHDDGRPLFLLVHTYRVHGPFRTGPEEDQTAFDEFVARGTDLMEQQEDRLLETRKQTLLPHLEEWVGLYEEGVKDMDFKFGRFRRAVEERGLFDSGYFVFTGDHGQAHGENQDIAHGGKLWESKVRIPLLLAGRDVVPADVETPVSLVDLAPTFGALAGVPAESDWIGSSLLATPANRPTFAFRLEGPGEEEVTILSGRRKVCALPDPEALRRGEILEAFDLEADPGELENLHAEEWSSELAREMADAVELFLRAKAEGGDTEADADLRRRLAEIGYGE